MKSENQGAPVAATSEMSPSVGYRRTLARALTGAVSGAALMAATGGVALAQTPADGVAPVEEVIVVTGIRASLRNSINIKRNLDVIAETVSAEDIGKLPDTSIAESLARLPGLAAERLDGRATRLSIRGLGPDFTTTLLNGREQVTTNESRGIEFDQYPSELLSGVNVYKTTDATLTAQGIAGTADLRTIRPLTRNERTIAFSARATSNSLGEVMPDVDPIGYRLTGYYIDQFMDGRLGVALGVAHMVAPNFTNRTEAYSTERTRAGTFTQTGNVITTGQMGANDLSPGGIKVLASSYLLERTGYMGVLQYEPTDNISINIDAYHSTFASEQNNRGLEINTEQGANTGWLASSLQFGPAAASGRRYLTSGTFRGLAPVRNIYNQVDAEVTAIGGRVDWTLNDTFKVGFDAGYSTVERTNILMETQPCLTDAAGNCVQVDFNYSIAPSGQIRLASTANFGDATRVRLTDPYGWGFNGAPAGGYIKYPSNQDELFTYRLDFEQQLNDGGAVNELRYGLMYSDRRKESRYFQGALRYTGNSIPIPASALVGTVDLGFGGLGQAVAFNPLATIGGSNGMRLDIPNVWWMGQRDWNVQELVTTAYFRANIDTEFGGLPVTGNFGFQYIHTDQSSDGFYNGYFLANNGNDGGLIPAEDGDTYGEMLPSLNLNVEVGDNFYVRFGASRVLSRPNMGDMRVSREINFNPQNIASTNPINSPYTGDGGNPLLRPTISRNFDISIERYFGRSGTGYVSFAIWQKNLDSYIRPGGDRYLLDLSGFPTPSWLGLTPAQQAALLKVALVSTPGNGSGGSLSGLEFAASVPFELFSPALEGFGVYFNVASNNSDVEFKGPNGIGQTELPGFSKTTGNLSVYYERYGFQARVSARYRSEFVQDVPNFEFANEQRLASDETIVDAQIGYDFQEGSPLHGLTVQLQAQNLTGEPWVTYYTNPYRGLNYDEYGTTYTLGLTYKF